ncbi:hypothetical protein CTEN210_03302 [Chaetoceros tenuissimus]|uniref:Uncharacterized protein n=1 Tax=Chaetoceros tenuissimus TaxID=426638 RepID=A0AAD3CJM4_9STRA|nr:hypothetical protein CTEN210_03302 [Chaetoceros tenuissimus]
MFREIIIVLLCLPHSSAFISKQSTSSYPFLWERYNSFDDGNEVANNKIEDAKKKFTSYSIIEKLLTGMTSDHPLEKLVPLDFVGKGTIGTKDTPCLFLTEKNYRNNNQNTRERNHSSSLPIPLANGSEENSVKLLSFAWKNEPISKSLCLTLNPLLINRDGGLFDNLPYAKWTIDPSKRNRDASGNAVEEKYHLGKRDCYNRFMGKDWYGRSLSIGNMAARAKYILEGEEKDTDQDTSFKDNSTTLALRILELEVKEGKMAVAESEEQLAILRTEITDLDDSNNGYENDAMIAEYYDAWDARVQMIQDAKQSLVETEEKLFELQQSLLPKSKPTPFVTNILNAIINVQQSDAPYRGATGYKPQIDEKNEMFEKSILPYSSPFELMKEIIDEQLNAEVIGCIIEDSSLFNGSVIFGGGVVLQRKGRIKEISINGEKVELDDSDDDFGNNGIKKGETLLVECDTDEAIGMAIACNVDIFMEKKEWDKSRLSTPLVFEEAEGIGNLDILPTLSSSIDAITIETQGEGIMSENTKIQAPRGSPLDMTFFGSKKDDKRPVFDTAIPIQSLEEFDSMSIQDKAQLLTSLDSFDGKLPRPRVLKINQDDGGGFNALDKQLLPLIDESTRREIMIRKAREEGNIDEVDSLESEKSARQIAKRNAAIAREEGNDTLAERWEKEAELYADLRADVTQDEGSYSRFLDRDLWYEKTRQKISEKNKKRFGSLLDGIE